MALQKQLSALNGVLYLSLYLYRSLCFVVSLFVNIVASTVPVSLCTISDFSLSVSIIRYDRIDDLHWKTDRQAAG